MNRTGPSVLSGPAVLCAILLFAGCQGAPSDSAKGDKGLQKVFFNGVIYTMGDASPVVEAIAVSDGRITAAGTLSDVEKACGPGAERFDLGGRCVIPGLTDAHAHFSGYALNLDRIDITGTSSLSGVVDLVAEKVKSSSAGEWVTGRGWDQNDWQVKTFPSRYDLDPASPDNPVFLVRVCGHAAVANSAALAAAGIDASTPDPAGGKIERDDRGEPTGLLIDEAVTLVSQALPEVSREKKKELFAKAARNCLAVGLTGVHEMGISSETESIYKEMYMEQTLPLRLTVYYSNDDEKIDSLLTQGPVCGFAGDMYSVAGVKFICDGSLGARSAALLDDYSDDPGNRGILMFKPEELLRQILVCRRDGFQVAVHAIGDRANRTVLDVLEKVAETEPSVDARDRIEHAQIVSPEDIPRFASLGVVPSMQFTHCTSDMPWVEDRLGSKRLEGAYAWRSFLSEGCRIPGGSDFPVESIDPFLGIYAAVTRKDLDGNPEGGWFPDQCLTVEEAVRSFTLDAAWAVHQEGLRGSLEPGKVADFIVLSTDIMKASPGEIPGIEVLSTVLGGDIVHRTADSPI